MAHRYDEIRRVKDNPPQKHAIRLDERQYPDMVCARCTCGEKIVAVSREALTEKFYQHLHSWGVQNKYADLRP